LCLFITNHSAFVSLDSSNNIAETNRDGQEFIKDKVLPLQAPVAQRLGIGIAVLFHVRGTRRGWVVCSMPRPHFTTGKTRYPFYMKLGGLQGRSGRAENLVPTGIRSLSVQPGVSGYTDWATGPTDKSSYELFPEIYRCCHVKSNGLSSRITLYMNYLSLNVRVTFPFGFPSCHILRLIVIHKHPRKLAPQKNFPWTEWIVTWQHGNTQPPQNCWAKTTIIIKNHFNIFLLIYFIL